MSELKVYELGDKKFHVPMICQAQEEILLGILAEVGILEVVSNFLLSQDKETEINFDQILKNLSRKRLLSRFLATLLVPVNAEFNEQKIEQIRQLVAKADPFLKFDVVQDFFVIMGKYEEQFKRISPILKERLTKLNHPLKDASLRRK